MKRINLFDFVELGKALEGVRSLRDESEPIHAVIRSDELRKQLKKVEKGELIEFGLLDDSINKVVSALDKIDQRWKSKDKNGNEYNSIGWAPRYYSGEAIRSFENVISAECGASATYFVSKVGIYSTNDLIQNASARFNTEMHSCIGHEALGQFQEAAQCLCYRLYTACGFHMMRAVEYVLLKYMKILCGRRFSSLNTNWGSYIAEMERISQGRSRNKPQEETIDLIRQIKNNHRNPVMHADFILTEQEAQDIFQLGSVVMSHLVDAIKRASKPKVISRDNSNVAIAFPSPNPLP